MDWLSGWLRAVVLIILVATFVDLLLPNHSLQRYVKTVVSLFILMTLLSPILQIFRPGYSLDKLMAAAWSETQKPSVPADGNTGEASLQAILREGERLKAGNAREARQMAEAKVAGMMKQEIESTVGRRVAGLQVHTANDPQGNPVIDRVDIRMSMQAAVPGEDSAGSPGREEPPGDPGGGKMEPVKPVQISIPPIQWDFPAANPKQDSGEDPTVPDGEAAQIRQLIGRQWRVPPEEIHITYSKAG